MERLQKRIIFFFNKIFRVKSSSTAFENNSHSSIPIPPSLSIIARRISVIGFCMSHQQYLALFVSGAICFSSSIAQFSVPLIHLYLRKLSKSFHINMKEWVNPLFLNIMYSALKEILYHINPTSFKTFVIFYLCYSSLPSLLSCYCIQNSKIHRLILRLIHIFLYSREKDLMFRTFFGRFAVGDELDDEFDGAG